uniref:Uncharacterized protein n=1 Tax=Rhizochromulina marina TaxID=1034831 RepID=A0A7S2SS18_9STRA|mmetsp:Transcript_5831/g.17024  ORF Transcript_5831/g.17024 Transcript_5831/m.17024 type:complete len:174 (+) Transcript_5831:11-532(+)
MEAGDVLISAGVATSMALAGTLGWFAVIWSRPLSSAQQEELGKAPGLAKLASRLVYLWGTHDYARVGDEPWRTFSYRRRRSLGQLLMGRRPDPPSSDSWAAGEAYRRGNLVTLGEEWWAPLIIYPNDFSIRNRRKVVYLQQPRTRMPQFHPRPWLIVALALLIVLWGNAVFLF